MRRQLATIATIAIASALVATVALWIRSHKAQDTLSFTVYFDSSTQHYSTAYGVATARGHLVMGRYDTWYQDGWERNKRPANRPEWEWDIDRAAHPTNFGLWPEHWWERIGFYAHSSQLGGFPFDYTVVDIAFPFWSVALLLASMLMYRAYRHHQHRMRERAAARGLCQNCGYDVRVHSGRCPECGTPVPEVEHEPAAQAP